MTTTYQRKRLKVPFRVRVLRFSRALLLLGVFALIPVFLWHQMRDSYQTRFTGVAEAEAETVGAVAAARIVSVEVQPGQPVRPGDVLVRLDPADRALDVALQEARLADYAQGVLRYEQGVLRDRQSLLEAERRCRQAVQEAEVALEAEKLNRARDEAERDGLLAEIERLGALVAKRLVSEVELAGLRPKAEALAQTVARYTPLIEAHQRRLARATQDLAEIRASIEAYGRSGGTKGEALALAESAFRKAAQSEPYVLRATRAGVVSRVQRQSGDVVVAGEPIVRVAATGTLHIVGLLTARQAEALKPGDKLKVARVGAREGLGQTAEVEALEPEVLDLLDPFNPAPRYSVRGRRVRLRVTEGGSLVPGETVALRPVRQESWLESVKRICQFSSHRPAAL